MESVAKGLEELAEAMEIAGENPFKVRAYIKAAGVVRSCTDLAERASREGGLEELPSVGKGIAETIREILAGRGEAILESVRAQITPGVLELVKIQGLGPKRAKVLSEELGLSSIAELEYACRENRVARLKGFGEKAQEKILAQIAFFKTTQGQIKLSDALIYVDVFLDQLKSALMSELKGVLQDVSCVRIEQTGELRRRLEVLSRIEVLVGVERADQKRVAREVDRFRADFLKAHPSGVPVDVQVVSLDEFEWNWLKTTGSEHHLTWLGERKGWGTKTNGSEEEIYRTVGLDRVPPECREEGGEVLVKDLVSDADGVGVFHNHTVASDGTATAEEMIREAERLGYRYIGLSDHSQSAAYAGGLKPADLERQHTEIQSLRKKFKNIRVFWGVESDILKNGSLDYSSQILSRFDFVVASVHQRYSLGREEMTARIVGAIRNRATRFIGHLTGRLLLGRPGYEIDMDTILREAAEQDVAIELNAHPDRLDIDWRHGDKIRRYGTKIAINPDAHSVAGLSDVRFGIWMAKKACLPRSLVVTSWGTEQVERWLARK